MASPIDQRGYAHPEVLVSTEWVEQHLNDPKVRLVESNEDTLLYASGHVPGAVHVDWTADLNDQIRRDYITREGFEALMSKIGASNDTTVVFYGDKSNWWACYAFWAFTLFGHESCKVMNGGRKLWIDEGRPVSTETPRYAPTRYVVAYCRIGERSSLTWFVLTYLLGYPSVRNYDGSWTEWGNLVRAPIARGA